MEALKRARRPVRREFENLYKELEILLKEEQLNEDEINVKFKLFCDVSDKLLSHDTKIIEQLAADNSPETEENKEWDEIAEFKLRAETMRQLKDKKLAPKLPTATESLAGGSNTAEIKVRNFKLPTVQMKRFNGTLEDWLGFWAQFQKIDEDPHMLESDKLWYLLQSLEPGTDAHELVTGYPLSNENYPIVIEALHKQYGDEDLQLQVYIRKLLKLVISNVDSKEKLPVKSLFLKLDSHLRALKTLNLERADPATWLFPLVESCLPDNILDNWQRSPLSSRDGSKEDPTQTRLDLLMAFVGREVEIQQRIQITRSFTSGPEEDKKQVKGARMSEHVKERRREKGGHVPTLSSFHSSDLSCVFCDKSNHQSGDCFRAKQMSHEAKIEILKKKGLCFRCTGKHLGVHCKEGVECTICKHKHLSVLCRDWKVKRKFDRESTGPHGKKRRVEMNETTTTTSSSNLECSSEVALKTLLVRVCNGKLEKVIRAFIDEGCQRSYISKATARELKLQPSGRERVTHSLFGGQHTAPVVHSKYEVDIESLDKRFRRSVTFRDQQQISGDLPNICKKYPAIGNELREKGVILNDEKSDTRKIEMLIGADLYPRIMTRDMKELSCGAMAVNTKLGWTLMGEVERATSVVEENVATPYLNMAVVGNEATSVVEGNVATSVVENVATPYKNMAVVENRATSVVEEIVATLYLNMAVVDGDITKLWLLETIGISDPSEEETNKKKEEMAILKFQENISRTENGRYSVRLPWKENLPWLPSNREVALKRLQFASRKLVEKGLFDVYDNIFREWEKEGFVEKIPESDRAEKVHYLPHRPVIKESLTTPVRPVFDASCRVGKSPSLNDCLYTGENCVKMIPDLIQRFRRDPIGFVSDIRKAFQMIGVEREDRDYMRFLWWLNEEMKEVVEFRHARVMFGATCSPFILAAVLHFHLTNLPEEDIEMGKVLLSSLYVDNCVHSVTSENAYREFRERASELARQAGMDLRMWLSNVDEFGDEATHVVSVLGLLWDRRTDELFVNVKGLTTPDKITKRTVLSTLHKLYDPVGFTCPAALQIKLMLQRLWKDGLKWDADLAENEARIFRKWCNEAAELGKIRIPRLSTAAEMDKEKWQLHIFSDACRESYSAAVFLRVETGSGVSVKLLAAKTRVAPLKSLSIPKLELTGCLIGVRLSTAVKKALNLEDISETYHTDSSTALAWIMRDDQWGTYVANRTREITKLTKKSDWRHVPGIQNPADLPSRGCSPVQLLSSRWWEGPNWLYEDEVCWPKSEECANENEVLLERKKSAVARDVCCVSIAINVQNSHSFQGHVRIVGWIRRFLHNKLVNNSEHKRAGCLTREELRRAEIMFLRNIQREEFPVNERGRLNGLEVVEDEWGLLRVKTRLLYRDDPPSFKYPILLPGKREEVKQLIRDYHLNYCHAGVGFLVTKLRQKYWILKARHTVKNVISKCQRCRRYTAKSVIPEAAPLPLDRVRNAEVFEVIGIDLAGPMTLRNKKKVWLVIFTCAIYRAVHFEIVTKISTTAFIKALERFVEKYRRPAVIYSDNGTNFRGADNLFRRIDWKRIKEEENTTKIEWRFNPVTSSWWGGWWERLIRTAKDLLRRTVGKGSLNMEELKTTVAKVAETMNERPLTYISEDPMDLEPLTPALFLHPHGNVNFPEAEHVDGQNLRSRFKYLKKLTAELKSRFVKEYLSMLVNHHPKKPTRNLIVGELVLVGCDNLKRLDWPLGRVTKLIISPDNVIRLAEVKTAHGEMTRSVQRLYPLEMDMEKEAEKAVRRKAVTTRSGRTVRIPDRFM